MAIKFEKKQSAIQKSATNKPKNKQPASLQKNPQILKKSKPKVARKPKGWQHWRLRFAKQNRLALVTL